MALNHSVTLLVPTTAADALGQPLPSAWAEAATLWADVRFTSGLEAVRAGGEQTTAACSVRVKRRAGLAASQRLQWRGLLLNILAVLPDPDGRHVNLPCEVLP